MEIVEYHEQCLLPDRAGQWEFAGLIHLLDCMQEAAGRHAERLGWGLAQLKAMALTWVLARKYIRFLRPLPPPGQELSISTWPTGKRSLYAIRDFRVTDEAGAEILIATSAWMLLNVDSRRPVRVDSRLPDFHPVPGRALTDDFPSLPVPADGEWGADYTVQPTDIDVNLHVNNLVYVERGLQALPRPPTAGRLPATLEVAFMAEAFAGDVMRCRTQHAADAVFIQGLLRPSDGRDLARLRWRWE